jgi:hypothetical protein
MTKTIELKNNMPIGKLSTGAMYDYVFDIHDASKTLDLKSLNYNFNYNKCFSRIDIYINDILIHSFLFPDAIGNKSPYYFIKEELLVSCDNTIRFRFQRNTKDYDISDFKVLVDILNEKPVKSIFKINSLVCPVLKHDDFFNISFDKTDSLKKVVFAAYEVERGIITDEVLLHTENQMYELICDKIGIGDTFELSGNDTLIYCKLTDSTSLINMYLIEYHPIEF